MSMTVKTWRQFGNAPSTVEPRDVGDLNPNGTGNTPPWATTSGGGVTNITTQAALFEAWGTATWHETSGRLRCFGGGHNDSATNHILAIDCYEDSPAWFIETPPTGAKGQRGSGASPCDDGNESSNVYFDKLPRSVHSYDNLVARGDEMWIVQPSAPFKSAGSGSGTNLGKAGLMRWTGKTWVQVAQDTAAIGGSGGSAAMSVSACYDESRDRIYVIGNGSVEIKYWDCTAGTKAGTSVLTNVSGGTTRSLYIPELDIIAVLDVGFSGHLGVYDYGRTAGASIHEPGATGSVPTSPTYSSPFFYSNGVWVPGWGGGVGAILCWHGGANFRVLTPPASGNAATTAWAWSTATPHASNAVTPGNPNSTGVFGRLWYSKRLGGIGLARSATEQPFFYATE